MLLQPIVPELSAGSYWRGLCYNPPMTASYFDLGFAESSPRQRHFLSTVLPALAELTWLQAIWLTGSLARGDADRWSDVNLHLLVDDQEIDAVLPALCTLLDHQIESGWHSRLQAYQILRGLTLIVNPTDTSTGGVAFTLRWTGLAQLQTHLERHRPLRLLFVCSSLSAEMNDYLTVARPALSAPSADQVVADLAYFWTALSRLPAVLNRSEHLAALALIDESRRALVNLVVALNGAQWPDSPARINQYLGPAQREAFDKTLAVKEVSAAAWIGQAVALIVLYRWYAPQLVEMYSVDYPATLEQTVLTLLAAEVPGWPALIRTG